MFWSAAPVVASGVGGAVALRQAAGAQQNLQHGMRIYRRPLAMAFGLAAVVLVTSAALMEAPTSERIAWAGVYVVICAMVYLAICTTIAKHGTGCIQDVTEFFRGNEKRVDMVISQNTKKSTCFTSPEHVEEVMDEALMKAIENNEIRDDVGYVWNTNKYDEGILSNSKQRDQYETFKKNMANLLKDSIITKKMDPAKASALVYGLASQNFPHSRDLGVHMPVIREKGNESNCTVLREWANKEIEREKAKTKQPWWGIPNPIGGHGDDDY
jgi:hypothetical protein